MFPFGAASLVIYFCLPLCCVLCNYVLFCHEEEEGQRVELTHRPCKLAVGGQPHSLESGHISPDQPPLRHILLWVTNKTRWDCPPILAICPECGFDSEREFSLWYIPSARDLDCWAAQKLLFCINIFNWPLSRSQLSLTCVPLWENLPLLGAPLPLWLLNFSKWQNFTKKDLDLQWTLWGTLN